MKRALLIFASSVTAYVWGMSEPPPVPKEIKEARIRVVDLKGVVHNLRNLRCDEGSVLKFGRGTLSYSLSLSSIRKIEVLGSEEGVVKVRVQLEDGKGEVFELPSSTRCTADSEVGSVSFYVNEVKSVEILKGERK